MDLLTRYLAAIRRNLPARDADDIIAELRDVLLAQAEEREERYGHVDWEALLKEFGHPLTVAARYRQQQWLIGPELYPFYLHFLKMGGAIVAMGFVVMAIIAALTHQGPAGRVISDIMGSLWWWAAATIGSITIVFALIERYGGVDKHFQAWKPSELPEIGPNQPGTWESIFEVALGVVFLLWWSGVVRLPYQAGGADFRLEAAPIWGVLFWPIFALSALRLVHNLIEWLRPGWEWLRGLLGIATAGGGLWLAYTLYKAGHWVAVVPTGMAPEQAAKLQDSLDLALGIAIPIVAVIWALQCLSELRRFGRAPRA